MYIYKTNDYDRVHNAWLAREPKLEDFMDETAAKILVSENRFVDTKAEEDFFAYDLKHTRWISQEPRLDYEIIEPGRYNVDIVTGPLTARKLLLHITGTSKAPVSAVLDVIRSNKLRHKHRGPYYHDLQINIYSTEMSIWNDGKHFIKLEVNLWQEIQEEAIAEAVEEAVAGVLTCARLPKIFRS